MPSMHRKHSNDGRRSRIHGRNSGGVHRQVPKLSQSDLSRSVSESKEEMNMATSKERDKGTRMRVPDRVAGVRGCAPAAER